MDSFDVMMAALRFNERINQGDPEGLTHLMTHDHVFIDNSGEEFRDMEEGGGISLRVIPIIEMCSPQSRSRVTLSSWWVTPTVE
jgi:hypothetical protein